MNHKQSIELLKALLEQDNFGSDGVLYTGVSNGELKLELVNSFNAAICAFIILVQENPTKTELLALLEKQICKFNRDSLETEDAENLAGKFEKIMDCVGLESSEGILNNWMYGFEV